MERDALTQKLEEMSPGLGALLERYTAAMKPFVEAQQALTDFIADKPEIGRKFALIGEISQTTGQQMTEMEILDVLTSEE